MNIAHNNGSNLNMNTPMKTTLPSLLVSSCLFAAALHAQEPPPPETMKVVSYGQGYDTGRQIEANSELINFEKFLEGFHDVLEERIPLRDANGYAQGAALALQLQNDNNPFDPEETLKGILAGAEGKEVDELDIPRSELEAATREFQAYMQQRQKAQQAQRQEQMREQLETAARENLEKGRAFLRENAKKEGVNTTLSQLQYKVVKEGEGESPALGDTVVVHYEGRLLDGQKFDSSIDRGKPQEVEVKEGAIIQGWVEALQLMAPGGRYKLWIPPELAYGESPRPLGPNRTLEFDVELIEVK